LTSCSFVDCYQRFAENLLHVTLGERGRIYEEILFSTGQICTDLVGSVCNSADIFWTRGVRLSSWTLTNVTDVVVFLSLSSQIWGGTLNLAQTASFHIPSQHLTIRYHIIWATDMVSFNKQCTKWTNYRKN
jgi:hypothetical protein